MLFFDHIYFSVNDSKFAELNEFFKKFNSVQSYKVDSKNGSWEGIYPFQEFGAFPEFLRATERNPNEQIGLAFSNINKSNLSKNILKNHPQIDWEVEEQFRSDGSDYYVSTCPKEKWNLLYLWILDWKGDYVEKRKNWGKVELNPFKKIKRVRLYLQPNNFEAVKQHSVWFSELLDEKDDVVRMLIPQYEVEAAEVYLCQSENDKQSFELELEVQNDFLFEDVGFNEIEVLFEDGLLVVRG